MCFSPLHIKNPKRQRNALFDRSVIEVPCGHCKQCIDNKRNGYFIRMYWEHLDCLSKGGFAYFLTLTYRPSDIAKLPTGDFCFRHDDVKLYLKRLRSSLQYHYKGIYTSKQISGCVRYFCCSEFGERRKRPHYHIVFFVTRPIGQFEFIKFARDSWPHGYTCPGKRNHGVVDGVSAFSYVAKYVTKSEADDKHLLLLKSKVRQYISDNHIEDDKLIRSLNYSCSLLTRTSVNFGMYLLSSTDYNDLLNGTITMPDRKYVLKPYPLPLYYDRKLFYDVVMVDGQPCYRLNEQGYKMKLKRFSNYQRAFTKSFRLVINSSYSSSTVADINSTLHTEYNSMDEVISDIKRYSIDLFNYSLIYNGYSSSRLLDDDGMSIVTMPYDDFDIRLRLLVGLPVSHDEIVSLTRNSSDYNVELMSTLLKVFRYLHGLCQQTKISDFQRSERIRHQLTYDYYVSQIYLND